MKIELTLNITKEHKMVLTAEQNSKLTLSVSAIDLSGTVSILEPEQVLLIGRALEIITRNDKTLGATIRCIEHYKEPDGETKNN